MQNSNIFLPEKIISDYGFKNMNSKVSHQKNWKDSVFKIYEKYHTKEIGQMI